MEKNIKGMKKHMSFLKIKSSLRSDEIWIPGRRLGGMSLILGSVLWALGMFLRFLPLHNGTFTAQQLADFNAQPFAAPGQLAAFQADPTLVITAYGIYLAGVFLLCPAVLALARTIASRCPGLALFGGTFALLSLVSRVYHAGVDHTAFALVKEQGVEFATNFVMGRYADISYGPLNIPVTFSALALAGWPLLAVGAYLSCVFGPRKPGKTVKETTLFILNLAQCAVLAITGFEWLGVLKESDGWYVELLLACVLVPLGVKMLRGRLPAQQIKNI